MKHKLSPQLFSFTDLFAEYEVSEKVKAFAQDDCLFFVVGKEGG